MNVLRRGFFIAYVIVLAAVSSMFWSTVVFASADPKPVTVTFNSATENSISIAWNEDSAAKNYTVWVKSEVQYTNWVPIEVTPGTSYTLNDCIVNDIYQFKVAAHGVKLSVMSQPLKGCTTFDTTAVVIKITKSNSEKGTVHLTATANGLVEKFTWLYKTLDDKDYSIKETTKPYVTLIVPNTAAVYEIRCQAVKKSFSDILYITKASTVKYVPDAAYVVKHKSGLKFKVKVNQVKGATGYIVQMKNKANGAWSTVAKLTAKDKRVTITQFKNKPLIKYKRYYVRVKTVCDSLQSNGKVTKKIRFTSD